jgi:hypothetical protein
MLLDLFAVPALLWHRTRIPAFVAVVCFHLTNAYLFSIGIFPWFSIAATLMFFPPDWKPFRVATKPFMLQPEDDQWEGLNRRLVVGILSAWVAIQLLMPIRHFFYPGLVHWNEEGHRFAWHMKLRGKSGTGALFVELEDGSQLKVDMRKHLTRRQIAKMRTRPDMLLQYAHFLAEEYADRGAQGVYAHVFVSLNGRPITRFIDPEVDLSEQPRTLGHAEWIIPFAESD